MENYTIKINNGNIEQEFEFRYDENYFGWYIYLNGVKTPHSIVYHSDVDGIFYDLCRWDEPIKLFEWDGYTLDNPSNLLEVMTYIMRNGN